MITNTKTSTSRVSKSQPKPKLQPIPPKLRRPIVHRPKTTPSPPPRSSSPSASSPNGGRSPGQSSSSLAASQASRAPTQAMEVMLRDVARANHIRRQKKREALLNGYRAALEDAMQRGKQLIEGSEERDRLWKKEVIEKLEVLVRRREAVEVRITMLLGSWEREFWKVVGDVGVAVGVEGEEGNKRNGERDKGAGAWEQEEEEEEAGEEEGRGRRQEWIY